ncbi:DUF2207 domain-containing protein [Alkalihalobacillus pseudalcaliphilus]|uniref:DUF2207 domain-containing protein n=1 Tax=Alkalihalobacillus pseudalcaliphilus TaxID=79884 RepID=UPI0023602CA3|nr:DUF2207 domain-containing protein [Alkalihalobacillus pseudalcaliphilus]
MHKKLVFIIMIAIFLLLIPTQTLAVDFTITNSEIDVHLQENGEIHVEEHFTYTFEDDFNGMTRELFPAINTTIHDFTAFEQNNQLNVELKDGQYYIYREGKENETVTFTLSYSIHHALKVYEDLATFAWSFHDSNNNTDFANYIISIYPPGEPKEVYTYGTDTLFNQEQIHQNGVVSYHLNELRAGDDGSVYLAMDADLFSDAPMTAHATIKDSFLADQQEVIVAVEKAEQRKEQYAFIGKLLIPLMTVLAAGLIIRAVLIKKRNIAAMKYQYAKTEDHPKKIISIPAAIFYTNYGQLPPEAISAALLDLVRQGYVKEEERGHFTLQTKDGMNKHEQTFTYWLFNTIGQGDSFSVKDMDKYAKNKKNRETYMNQYHSWINAVKMETKEANLVDSQKMTRIFSLILMLINVPFLFFFPLNGLIAEFVFTLILALFFLLFSCFYSTKTLLGEEVIYEWQAFQKSFNQTPQQDWTQWDPDKLKQAIIYSLGTKNKHFMKDHDKLVESFKNQANVTATNHNVYSHADPLSYLYLGAIISQSTRNSNQAFYITDSGSSSHSSSGSGAGGSGGGNGAF